MAGAFTADDEMEKRKKKREREYLLIAYSTHFSTKKKKTKPETSRLNELKDKKHLDNKSKAYLAFL